MNNEYENIQPWNGEHDTGYDVRKKLERNFEKVKSNFSELKTDSHSHLNKELLDKIDQNLSSLSDVIFKGLSVDYLTVNKKAIFELIQVVHEQSISGKWIISPGGSIECNKVDTSDNYYRCYFLNDQENKRIENKFKEGDLAKCKSYNIKSGIYENVSNKYYWRKVVSVGDNYIDLSITDCDTNSDIPQKGDTICQLGSETDKTRQRAIVISSVDENSPSFTIYNGIDSYSLIDKEYVEFGVDPTTGKAFQKVYGDSYIGDRSEKNYIRLENDVLTICAKLISQATGKNVDDLLDSMQKTISNVKNQTDKQFVIWFGDTIPTADNEPAKRWNTDELRNEHLDDWYFIRSTAADGGHAYRYEQKEDKTFCWNEISDKDTIAALEKASKAKEVADSAKEAAAGKMRVFVAQPVAPYSVGDLWANASYTSGGVTYENDLLKCKSAKAEGFDIADWEPASNATTAYIKNLGDSIQLEILGKDSEGTEKLLSALVADKTGFKIVGNKITLDAVTVANLIMSSGLKIGVKDADGNFTEVNCTIDEKGHIVAKDVQLSGNINASSGKIGNLDIMNNGALKGTNMLIDNVSLYTSVFGSLSDMGQAIVNAISKHQTTIVIRPSMTSLSGTATIQLPSVSQLNAAGIDGNSGISLTIIVRDNKVYDSAGSLVLKSNVTFRLISNAKNGTLQNGEIVDNTGTTLPSIDMTDGNTIRLYYFAGVYSIISFYH